MRNMMKKAAQNVKAVAVRAGMLMKDTKGENYVDTAVKILIAVVLGALLLAGLYALFGDVVMPTLSFPALSMLPSTSPCAVGRFSPFLHFSGS